MQNTAKRAYTEPYLASAEAAREEQEAQAQRERKRKERQKRHHEELVKRELRRIKQRARHFSLGELVVLLSALVIITASTSFYQMAKTELANGEKKITQLEEDLAKDARDNDNLETLIELSIDKDAIEAFAKERGMHYPAAGQVIRYRISESERLTENEKIPK